MGILIYPIILVLSLIEWYLSSARVSAIAKGNVAVASIIVFAEEMLSFGIMFYAIVEQDWLVALFSAVGGSLGVILSMRKFKRGG
jgi:hypothetical protein